MTEKYDINICKFTGTVSQIKPVQTKTGTAMTVFLLQCWRTRISCSAFKEIAKTVLEFREGERAAVSGRIEENSYQKNDGTWVNSFRLVVKEISPDTESTRQDKPVAKSPDPQANNPAKAQADLRQQEHPDPAPDGWLNQYDYQGGPF